MSTSIPSTGLFVEAAYGVEGVPGQSGVMGLVIRVTLLGNKR